MRWSAAELSACEDAVLSSAVKEATFEHVWHEQPLLMHSLVAWRGGDAAPDGGDKPVLLFVHGTAGSSVGFSGLLDKLTEQFVVHCLDLPGFGKSPSPRAWRGPVEEVVQLYCACLRSYVTGHKLARVCIVAHSFGGYLAAKLIERHPEVADALILVNAAGIYPTLGRTGAFWALFFQSSLPQSLLRALGPAATATFRAIAHLAKAGPFAQYYYLLYSCPEARADTFVGRLISGGFLQGLLSSSRWLDPTLPTLLRTRVPLGFIHGADDGIMPVHQPRAFVRVCGAAVPLCVIAEAGHAPYADRPEAFCEALLRVRGGVRAPGPAGRHLADKLDASGLLSQYKSSFSVAVTSRVIADLYRRLEEASAFGLVAPGLLEIGCGLVDID